MAGVSPHRAWAGVLSVLREELAAAQVELVLLPEQVRAQSPQAVLAEVAGGPSKGRRGRSRRRGRGAKAPSSALANPPVPRAIPESSRPPLRRRSCHAPPIASLDRSDCRRRRRTTPRERYRDARLAREQRSPRLAVAVAAAPRSAPFARAAARALGVEHCPVEHCPVEHCPVEHCPVEHCPVEHCPVEHCPVEHCPVEHCPVEHCPVEHCPVEHCPVEHCPVEHCPVEHCPVEHCRLRRPRLGVAVQCPSDRASTLVEPRSGTRPRPDRPGALSVPIAERSQRVARRKEMELVRRATLRWALGLPPGRSG